MIKKKVVAKVQQQSANKVGEGLLRLQNDIKNFEQRTKANKELTNVKLSFPNEGSLNPIHIVIEPKTGLYAGSRLTFVYTIPEDYPYKSPVLECKQKVFHPNIDPQIRTVCLSILKDGWQANHQLIEVIYGLWQILQCLSHSDCEKPLDARAAQLFKEDQAKFREILLKTFKGESFQGRPFDNVWVGK